MKGLHLSKVWTQWNHAKIRIFRTFHQYSPFLSVSYCLFIVMLILTFFMKAIKSQFIIQIVLIPPPHLNNDCPQSKQLSSRHMACDHQKQGS